MPEQFVRTEMLLGKEAMDRLYGSRVAVFGIGGVGGYVCEALVRSGVGAFELTDNDRVALSNLNRQIIATHSTVGRYKTEVMRERMLDINPGADISIRNCFFLPENADSFDFSRYDYVVDAVDTVTAKIEIIMKAKEAGIPVISAMGAGNKLDATRFRVADIYDTRICPLARVMRRELRKRSVDSLKVVYSDEEPLKAQCMTHEGNVSDEEGVSMNRDSKRRSIPGSSAFAPSAAGLVIASEVVRDLAGLADDNV